MNEGDPSYLRSKAKRYRLVAKNVKDTETQNSLYDLAGELEQDATHAEREAKLPSPAGS